MAKEYIEPMKPIVEQIVSSIRTQQEDSIMRAVCDCGIVVDKERLVQALTDARSFYEEGYRAAMNAADVVEVVRCQNCVHAEPFERNCVLNSSVYMHCTRGRGEEVRNVWHKYKKYYRDYSVVDRDGYCDEGERRTDE